MAGLWETRSPHRSQFPLTAVALTLLLFGAALLTFSAVESATALRIVTPTGTARVTALPRQLVGGRLAQGMPTSASRQVHNILQPAVVTPAARTHTPGILLTSPGCWLASLMGALVAVALFSGRLWRNRPAPLAMCSTTGESATATPATSRRPWTTQDWYWSPEPGTRFRINYATAGSGERVVVLVHGFGADVNNWRAIIPFASAKYTVYAIDLLGYGSSEKPTDYPMSIDLWARQVTDFCKEFVPRNADFAVVGNSIGSLVAVTAAGDAMVHDPHHDFDNLKGILLFNCAGGMNNKFQQVSLSKLQKLETWDEYVIFFLSPLFGLVDRLLQSRPFAEWLFSRIANEANVAGTLQSIYTNPARVDDELVQDILKPAADEGALEVFVSTITGDPGRSPIKLVPSIPEAVKVAVLWGEQDKLTPISGKGARFFEELSATKGHRFRFQRIDGGHVLHDDVPETSQRWLDDSLQWMFHEDASTTL